MQIWPGTAYPLGATYDGSGTNFALFSEIADSVELCLFDADGTETRVELPEVDAFVWHAFLPGRRARPAVRVPRARAGQVPTRGCAATRTSCCWTPTPRPFDGTIEWDESLFGYHFGDPDSHNDDDSAANLPKCVVINPFYDWGVDRPPKPRVRRHRVLRGTRASGMTMTHPDVPEELRGTYAGIAHPVRSSGTWPTLGVTAIELMPVHHFVNDSTLDGQGPVELLGLQHDRVLFAPDHKYSARAPRRAGRCRSFKTMVRALHEADIEVILDVVYNHTAEGNHLGPTLSFRGIDNPAYYRLVEDDPHVLHGLHRHREHAERPAPRTPCS